MKMSYSMKVLNRKLLYTSHSKCNIPGITIEPGKPFIARTELCTGSWLTSIDDKYHPDKAKGPNPCVVAKIAGTVPGDILAVSIIDIIPDQLGYTGFESNLHTLSQKIYRNNWGVNTKTVLIEDGYIKWDEKTKIPVMPMIGTLGTAPAEGEIPNSYGGPHGGNLDVNEIKQGSVVYLNVSVPGALLHIGDVHAIQGDGEINGAGGIECRADVVLKVDILRGDTVMKWIRIEDDEYIMSVACEDTTDNAFYSATGEMLSWMVEEYGYKPEDAYLLMGQLMSARCTQFVNPTRTYICKMPKKYL